MSAREHVASYLGRRVREAFNNNDLAQAQDLNNFLGAVERLTDAEFDGLSIPVAVVS